MKKVEVEIRLFIKFYDSFFFGGGTGNGNIQSYLLRDINGMPYISGAALKGCIAEYAEVLSGLVPAFDHGAKLFGVGGVQKGCLYFENGTLMDAPLYDSVKDTLVELRTGISISDYTGAKREGHLYTMELSGLSGRMVFQSSIYGFLDMATYQKDIAHLVAATRLLFALGGKRSSGIGWLESPIECQVFQGERGQTADSSKQELICTECVNQWIREWIEGRNV